VAVQGLDIHDWWSNNLSDLSKERSFKAAVMMYVASNLWKERNRRIFEGKRKEPVQIIHEIKAEMLARNLACGSHEIPENH
jgi:acyl CoA:acetate/3-ketoacid CoA transferase alpha subunit